MLTEYIKAGMRRAHFGIFDNGAFHGEIEGVLGLWAYEDTLEACREELQSAFEDWLLFSLQHGAELPLIDGIDLNPTECVEEETC